MDRIKALFNLANELAITTTSFFGIKGLGKGSYSIKNYINAKHAIIKINQGEIDV